ncbi:rab-GTPase-TBC domain-containing protein [Mucor mucedo]|uniref:rab-GTPase-TBC domain-containing protein n=1 Tax=Mucor mucedo TaxID=29922 RepID=UPI00221F8B70|nr:rab-GTPase-TBC domain-containing protein [Mucor mucedo]KAI7865986.1 rab-GTPase-TBC domain-containing protein [Mucor mucedo]
MARKQRKQRKQKKNVYREKPAQENPQFQDTFKINQALKTGDYQLLRDIGRETGFSSDAIRRRVWPYLLHCTDPEIQNTMEGSPDVPHKDESQVKLDVVRSFNSYPKNVGPEDKAKLEGQLDRVITHVLRAYPSLHYYQGFHDICSVFILLFGEKYAYEMFVSMEPILKQLTILDTLIRLEDVELYDFITEAGVLPYYCLSWVITWCSHDLDDLEKITRLFDLFLCSNPFMSIYFAAAVVLSRRDQVLALECEISTLHSFLTKLPKDLDIQWLCQKACELEKKYPVFDIQCESTIALDELSTVNRFEKDWVSIQTQEELDKTLQDSIIPLLKDKEERKPIKLLSKLPQPSSNSILQKLRQLDRKDMALYTLVTIGAGVGLLAMFMSNADLVREWLLTGV